MLFSLSLLLAACYLLLRSLGPGLAGLSHQGPAATTQLSRITCLDFAAAWTGTAGSMGGCASSPPEVALCCSRLSCGPCSDLSLHSKSLFDLGRLSYIEVCWSLLVQLPFLHIPCLCFPPPLSCDLGNSDLRDDVVVWV